MKHYADRDSVALGQHFANHMDAMTREGLDGKFEIADELAWRDRQVELLTEALKKADAALLNLVAFYNTNTLKEANAVREEIKPFLPEVLCPDATSPKS